MLCSEEAADDDTAASSEPDTNTPSDGGVSPNYDDSLDENSFLLLVVSTFAGESLVTE